MTDEMNYILWLHQTCGFSWEFIAKDCGVELDSLMRRLDRNGIKVSA